LKLKKNKKGLLKTHQPDFKHTGRAAYKEREGNNLIMKIMFLALRAMAGLSQCLLPVLNPRVSLEEASMNYTLLCLLLCCILIPIAFMPCLVPDFG
jgi:hypothetical protein